MYSLYRAWLMRDAVVAAAAAAAAQPADVVVSVGGAGGAEARQFAAHRAVLAAHSGYLKALLATAGPAVCLPTVAGDAFAPLLAFMYTGVLDLNRDNIYSVLLATHLLHMPRALDLCRAYLQQPPPPPPPPPLVKPVPSRKLPLLGLPYWPPPPHHHVAAAPLPPPPPLLPHMHGESPFRCVAARSPPASPPAPATAPAPPPAAAPATPSTSSAPGSASVSASGATQPEQQRQPPSPSPSPGSLSPCLSASSRCDSSSPSRGPQRPPPQHHKPSGSKHRSKSDDAGSSSSSKVIIDVACCDGPVRFHRVLNDNYGLLEADTAPAEVAPAAEGAAPSHHQQQQQQQQQQQHKAASSSTASTSTASSSSASGSEAVYTCVYCNHTFKSHYCYQKHARRHINPVTSLHAAQARKVRPVGPRREARLLDMNVQYYPCKTCGSKFPSYYFVHKHRKLCHASEDSDSAPGPTSDESRSQPSAPGPVAASSSAAQ